MKLLIFILLFSINSYGVQNWYPVGKAGAKTIYLKKKRCQKKESQECFEVSDKDLRRYSVAQVDDISNPKYLKADSAACSGNDDCIEKLGLLDCTSHPEGSFGVIGDKYDEIYCAVFNGYKKKTVLVVDPAKVASVDAEDAEKEQKKKSRNNKRSSRKIKLKQCAKYKIADFTASIQKNCIREIARELMRLELTVEEL